MTEDVPTPIEGQLDVYDCLEEAEKDRLDKLAETTGVPKEYLEPSTARTANGADLDAHHRRSPKSVLPMTPAQIVALKMKEKADGD